MVEKCGHKYHPDRSHAGPPPCGDCLGKEMDAMTAIWFEREYRCEFRKVESHCHCCSSTRAASMLTYLRWNSERRRASMAGDSTATLLWNQRVQLQSRDYRQTMKLIHLRMKLWSLEGGG